MLLISIKVALTIVFVATGGAVFSRWGQRHRVLTTCASTVAIIGAVFLGLDLWETLRPRPSPEGPSAVAPLPELPSEVALRRVGEDGERVGDDVVEILAYVPGVPDEAQQRLRTYRYSTTTTRRVVYLGDAGGGWSYDLDPDMAGYARLTSDFSIPEHRILRFVSDSGPVYIYNNPHSEWLVVSGPEGDGKFTTYYINFAQRQIVSSTANSQFFVEWSPSGRYIVNASDWEESGWLSIVDLTDPRRAFDTQWLQDATDYFLPVEYRRPMWAADESQFMIVATENVLDGGRQPDARLLRVEVPSLELTAVN